MKSMAYISEQLSAPANRVAVINLKVLWKFELILVRKQIYLFIF